MDSFPDFYIHIPRSESYAAYHAAKSKVAP